MNDILEISVNGRIFWCCKDYLRISKYFCAIMDDSDCNRIDLDMFESDIFSHVINIIKQRQGREIENVSFCVDLWKNKKVFYKVLNCINYLDIQSLFSSMCMFMSQQIKNIGADLNTLIYKLRNKKMNIEYKDNHDTSDLLFIRLLLDDKDHDGYCSGHDALSDDECEQVEIIDVCVKTNFDLKKIECHEKGCGISERTKYCVIDIYSSGSGYCSNYGYTLESQNIINLSKVLPLILDNLSNDIVQYIISLINIDTHIYNKFKRKIDLKLILESMDK